MTTKKIEQERRDNQHGLLRSEEQAILSQIATEEAPYSQRAQALLAIDWGATQAEAGYRAGLTRGQVRYWLGKFRKEGMSIFPQELLNQPEPEDAGEDEAQQEMPDAEKAAAPVAEAATRLEDASKAKKKPKKKPKKSRKKSKKTKVSKKKKKTEKGKKKGKKPAKKGKNKKKSKK